MKLHDQDQIRRIFEEVYPDNVRSGDLSAYADMYTEDALWMPPNGLDRCGIPDILEGFADTIADKDIDPIFTAEEIEVKGDFGSVIGISLATISPKDGSPSTQVKYRALWLMKKDCDRWKISRQIWNVKP
ncbi:YybH family protein [Anabaena sp. CCY 9910]|uniref:YybH family protein n=1 Tax=Anabaena sp. CCY 9910 TaxID=3103870 RepID=UPI0039DF40FD